MNNRYFFRSRHIEFLCSRKSILATYSKTAHSKIIGNLFQDEFLMIQSFFTTGKKIMNFWALMGFYQIDVEIINMIQSTKILECVITH